MFCFNYFERTTYLRCCYNSIQFIICQCVFILYIAKTSFKEACFCILLLFTFNFLLLESRRHSFQFGQAAFFVNQIDEDVGPGHGLEDGNDRAAQNNENQREK